VASSNASSSAYAKLLEGLDAENKCPLDPGVFPEERISRRVGGFILATNRFPYENTERHLLIFPERHLDSIAQMEAQDWNDLIESFKVAQGEYGTATGALVMRYSTEGNYQATGATISHPHAHIIVPQLDPETSRVPGHGTLGAP
jgi:diadenosine tetraphosphate (Ap4A) HIT family hydrolase